MMHTLIVGSVGVGKSTLIRRVLKELQCPVAGFETHKSDTPAEGGYPVYLYEIGKPKIPTEENRIGICSQKCLKVSAEVFDKFAPRLLLPLPEGTVFVMDELGTLENASPAFRSAVLQRLDGDVPVIAAVKQKDTPFLNAIRSHPKCRCFYLTEENRNEVFSAVMASGLQDR